MLMLQFLTNTCNNVRAKTNTSGRKLTPQDTGPDTAGPSTATATADPSDNKNNGDNDNENQPDVTVSDISE
jgi:hypothetical protein